MAKKKLVISIALRLEISSMVKIIRNDDWVTLAKKSGNRISVLTLESKDIQQADIDDEHSWIDYTKEELKKLAAL